MWTQLKCLCERERERECDTWESEFFFCKFPRLMFGKCCTYENKLIIPIKIGTILNDYYIIISLFRKKKT